MIPHDFDPLTATALESRLWLATRAATHAVAVAWSGAKVVATIRGLNDELRGWTVAARISGAAIAVATATLTHFVLLSMAPRYVASGLSSAWLIVVAATAVMVALAPMAFVRAWPGSRFVRTFRWLVNGFQNNDE